MRSRPAQHPVELELTPYGLTPKDALHLVQMGVSPNGGSPNGGNLSPIGVRPNGV